MHELCTLAIPGQAPCAAPAAWEVCNALCCDPHLSAFIKICEGMNPGAPHQVRSIE
jgi:hypothetical protein